MQKEILLTAEGLQELEAELEQLKTVQRREIAEKIKVALSFGDLSENSEYDEAKNEQGKLESRILEIESMLQYVKIIDENALDLETVGHGSTVKVRDVKFDETLVYHIVGFAQADPDSGNISDESPVGRALLGKKAGDRFEVEAPMGTLEFEVLEIS